MISRLRRQGTGKCEHDNQQSEVQLTILILHVKLLYGQINYVIF
jgi:hypothetical protein